MTYKTKAIVLRTVKYGETSLVVTVFTELFGVQTYMVNGVRSSKKSSAKANYFLPGAILDLVVYHHEQKNMQRIREFGWAVLYQHVLSDVIKNSIALYMVELLYKSLKQPEQNESLFYFCEDVFLYLDKADRTVTANIPLYFALHLSHFLGFKINDDYDEVQHILDLREGSFVTEQTTNPNFMDGEYALLTSQLLKVMHPEELANFQLHHEVRRKLLHYYHNYYGLHIHDFGEMKTLAVLQDVF
ncbi:MAG: DNA repair protein RecO [Chitinophagaceae bacterium]|nr:DNA repair protein RecO [Chitinophagaceae bacterium]